MLEVYRFGKFICNARFLKWCDWFQCGFINPITLTIYLPRDPGRWLVLHEYGHTLQAKELGCLKYLVRIGIPSLLSFTFTRSKHKTRWFEIDATERGGYHLLRSENDLVFRVPTRKNK